MLHSLVRNTFFQVFAKTVSVVGGIVLAYVLGRRFGESGFGVYTFVMSFVLFFGNLSDWGTSLIAVREASKADEEKRKKIFTTSLITRFSLSILSFLLLNILVRLNPSWRDFTLTTTIASFVLFFLSLKTSLSIVFQTKLRFDAISFIEIVSTLGFVGVSVLLLLSGGGIDQVMAAWVLSTTLAFVLGAFLVKTKLTPLFFDKGVSLKIVKESFPTGALLIVSTIYNRADVVILQHFHSTSDVGVYGMAYKVYETVVFGASYIMNAMFPLLSKMYSSGEVTQKLKEYMGRAFGSLLFVGILVAVLTYFAAPYLPLVFQGKFDFSVLPLRILSFALVFSYLNHFVGYTLIAIGKQRAALVVAGGALVFNLALNILFVPQFSFIASSYLTITTEALVLLLSGFVLARNLYAKRDYAK